MFVLAVHQTWFLMKSDEKETKGKEGKGRSVDKCKNNEVKLKRDHLSVKQSTFKTTED